MSEMLEHNLPPKVTGKSLDKPQAKDMTDLLS